jgi:hypothetical protein
MEEERGLGVRNPVCWGENSKPRTLTETSPRGPIRQNDIGVYRRLVVPAQKSAKKNDLPLSDDKSALHKPRPLYLLRESNADFKG